SRIASASPKVWYASPWASRTSKTSSRTSTRRFFTCNCDFRLGTESQMSSSSIAPSLAGRVLGSIDDAFVIAEWRDAGGPPGPPRLIAPRHLHRRDDEAWYVLEGTLRIQVGKREVVAPAGSAVFVPRGMAHTYWNPGPGPVRYLLV